MQNYNEKEQGVTTADRQQAIWYEQMRLIDRNARLSNYVSLLVALFVVYTFWGNQSKALMLGWFGFMALLSLTRVVLSISLDRSGLEAKPDQAGTTAAYGPGDQHADNTLTAMYKLYMSAIVLTAAGWGAAAFFLFPENPQQQVILCFVIAGISSAGIFVMTPVYRLYLSFLVLSVAPLMLRLYLQDDAYQLLSLMMLVYLLVMAFIGYRVNARIVNGLELRFHNQSLIKFMSDARNETEDLNEELAEEVEQRKRAEKALYKAKEQAEAANRSKTEFLANMSHEIRTPMNGIIGTLQLLQGSELNESQASYVNIAYSSAESLLCLLNDILDSSKIEAGKLELENVEFDLGKTINQLQLLMRPKADERRVSLSVELDEKLPQTVIGDPVRTRQILVNLLSNAIKFTEDGYVRTRLAILEQGDEQYKIRIEVEDNGIGIPEPAQRKLFNAFTQADGSTTREYGGSGLGLSIVRQLVMLMHGRVGLVSEPGEGSTFWIELNFSRAEKAQQQGIENEELTGHVLLVEDNPVNQMIAKKMLERLSLSYQLAENGEQAVALMQAPHDFSLLLMDCQMPVMDGYTATRTIRQFEIENQLKHTPIIAMTANTMENDKQACMQVGMDDYITKPVAQDALQKVLSRWLRVGQ